MSKKIKYRNLPEMLLRARGKVLVNFRGIWGHYGLTDQQWRILRVLDEANQLEPRELCEICQISSPSMAGILKRMEEVGLVARQSVAADQRRILISVAPRGEALIAEIAPLIDAQYKYLEKAYGRQVMQQMIDMLEHFNGLDGGLVQQVALPELPEQLQ